MAKIPNAKTQPLERSSYEFMVALLVGIFIPFLGNWEARLVAYIVLAGAAIYFCCYSKGSAHLGKRQKFILSVLAVGFIASFAYGQIKASYDEEHVIPKSLQYLTLWGPTNSFQIDGSMPPKVINGKASTFIKADGRLLEKYKDKFELMGVALHSMNGESYMDKKDVCKSAPVRIKPEDLYIPINFNTQFLVEMQQGAGAINFYLLAIPKKMNLDFETLNDAEDRGAQILAEGGSAAPLLQTGVTPPQ